MKVDFRKIKLLDIDGKKAKAKEEFHKTIANLIFKRIKNLDLVDIAREINLVGVVELSKTDMAAIKTCVLGVPINEGGLWSFAKEAFVKFFDEIEEQEKKKRKKK